MLFHSAAFAVFLPVVWTLYWLLRGTKQQNALLLAASWVFYGWWDARFLLLLGELAVCLGEAGEVALGLATVEETLARCEARDERWYVAELLRIKGGLLLRQGGPDAPREAERLLGESLDWSQRQQAAGWELRASISLGALWRDHGRIEEARRSLEEFAGDQFIAWSTWKWMEAQKTTGRSPVSLSVAVAVAVTPGPGSGGSMVRVGAVV